MKDKNITFKDRLKAWGKFFISPYFIKNFCIYIATVLLFFVLVVQGLKIYTRHSQKISVPSVEGMTIKDAEKIIRERGLIPNISDSTYTCNSTSIKPGYIIPNGQIPTAGYQVKKGRVVYLTYLAYTKEPTKLPNIVGESIVTARSLLIGSGLIPGNITEIKGPNKDNVKEARFNGAKISYGKELHKGDVIDLTIEKGEDDDEEYTNPINTTSESLPEEFDNGIDEF